MASFSWKQWAAIGSASALLALLYFINRTPPVSKQGGAEMARSNSHAAPSISIDSILSQANAQVPAAIKAKIDGMAEEINGTSAKKQATLLNSIISLYDSAGVQIPAAFYTEKLAALNKSTDLWCQAGDIYYRNAEVVTADAHTTLLQRAMQCYDNSLKLDSNNTAAVVGKGECTVEGGGSPMQGIMMIEGVLKKDSNNEKAQIALGRFSIQSGQYAKALFRFHKVLKIDPTYNEAYLYLAEAYQSSGDTNTAITYLKKYSTFVRDTVIKSQVDNYIIKLENKKPK